MDKIETKTFLIEQGPDDLAVTHKPTGVRFPLSLAALESWLLRKLRELF
jgi:hypothetical protein